VCCHLIGVDIESRGNFWRVLHLIKIHIPLGAVMLVHHIGLHIRKSVEFASLELLPRRRPKPRGVLI